MPGPRQRFVTLVFLIAVLAFGSLAFGNPTTLPQRRSQQSKPESPPVKKGKKGLASNSKKPESTKPPSTPASKPSSKGTTTAAVVKPATVTPTIAQPPPSTPLAPVRAVATPPAPITKSEDKIDVSSIERRRSHRLPRLAM